MQALKDWVNQPYGYARTLLCMQDHQFPLAWHCSKHYSVKDADTYLATLNKSARTTLLFPPWIVWNIPTLLTAYARWRLNPVIFLTNPDSKEWKRQQRP